jgi:hypothetical protein
MDLRHRLQLGLALLVALAGLPGLLSTGLTDPSAKPSLDRLI